MKYAISACLMGKNCKYNGGNNKNEALINFLKDKDVITICPEVTGGLPTPRAPSEIVGNRVINTLHEDVTFQFEQGARQELQRVLDEQVDVVILQPRSPSCGKGMVYDGHFEGMLIPGDGIFVQLLKKHKIDVYTSVEFLEKLATNQK